MCRKLKWAARSKMYNPNAFSPDLGFPRSQKRAWTLVTRRKTMMKTLISTLALTAAFTAVPLAFADEWVDYAPSKEPWTVTTVKVAPGKLDDYIVGLKNSYA